MVLKKRVDYGFRGYRIPAIPRAPRSVRKRGPRKKSVDENQISAFELLASVAGKLLQKNESSASSNAEEGHYQIDILGDGIEHEQSEGNKGFRSECLDQGSCAESAFMPDSAIREQNSKSVLDEIQGAETDSVMEPNSVVTSSEFSKDINLDLKLEICINNNADGDLPNKAEGGSSNLGNLYNVKINNGSDRQVEDDKKQTGDLIAANTGCLKDPTEKCVNNNALINSESNVQLPLYRHPVPSSSFAKRRNNVKLGFVRDDDENSFGCNSTKVKAFRQQSRFGYRRIRKILRSKYRIVAPKLKDSDLANSYGRMKPFYCNRKRLYPRERCLREAPSKRRKLYDRSFLVACHQEASSKSISNSREKLIKGENCCSAALLQRASGTSALVKGLQKSGDANVKFSIKSFKVPELYIEVPETATVGALKRTVMEAVTSILGGGLRVGVVLKGKRVRDDKRTLQQAGISGSSNIEALGFTLEPSFIQVSSSASPKQPPMLHPLVADHRLSRSPAKPNLDLGLPISSTSNEPASVTKIEKPVEISHVFGARNPADTSSDGVVQDCKALVPVPVPEMNAEALAVVPINHKPKCSELPQRRTRRPFSVAEVEALVEAVEKLGTGRWRDVKMRAFDNADHRTYVDLKDKWKTLVHTASISPQQRRGEPVPQELLDRVLSVHAYWSQHQHQAKQHGKAPRLNARETQDGQVERVGA